MQRVIKLKKTVHFAMTIMEPMAMAMATPVPIRRVIKLKKQIPSPETIPIPATIRRTIKLKKQGPLLSVPPPPPHGLALTPLAEAFEAIREYYAIRGQQIPQEDLKWYQTELALEKKEMDEFWQRCSVTKAIMEETMKSYTTGKIDEIALMKVEIEAKALQKSLPIRKEDIGPMPSYGTPEFWAWCHRRKKLRLQEEAAIIAAGGTVKPKKAKAKK
jgi:hypothetical protein